MTPMTLAGGVGDAFAGAVDGTLLLGVPIALIAGLVSFLSPCVLPLVPGYLSYVTGMSGADLDEPTPTRGAVPATALRESGARGGIGRGSGGGGSATLEHPRLGRGHRHGRVLLGSILFVAGFSAVFVSYGALFGGLGATLRLHERTLTQILGVITIVLGLAFLGLLPGLQREVRIHRLPTAGLAGAPLLGMLFGLGWTPCIGPTLGVVLTLSASSATAGRGALLTTAYCVGLGVPFLLVGLAFRRAMGAVAMLRHHTRTITGLGGGLLVLIGVAQLTGWWTDLMIGMQGWSSGFTPGV